MGRLLEEIKHFVLLCVLKDLIERNSTSKKAVAIQYQWQLGKRERGIVLELSVRTDFVWVILGLSCL